MLTRWPNNYTPHGDMIAESDIPATILSALDDPAKAEALATVAELFGWEPHDDEWNLVREWFDAVQDLNPKLLEAKDYLLAERIYKHLGWHVPKSIEAGAAQAQEETK